MWNMSVHILIWSRSRPDSVILVSSASNRFHFILKHTKKKNNVERLVIYVTWIVTHSPLFFHQKMKIWKSYPFWVQSKFSFVTLIYFGLQLIGEKILQKFNEIGSTHFEFATTLRIIKSAHFMQWTRNVIAYIIVVIECDVRWGSRDVTCLLHRQNFDRKLNSLLNRCPIVE